MMRRLWAAFVCAWPALAQAQGFTSGSTGADGALSLNLAGPIAVARSYVTAVPLNDGRVLVCGGYNGDGVNTAEIFDPKLNLFVPTGSLNVRRYAHAATTLPDGKVLVTGGCNSSECYLNSAELFDPATGRFSMLSPMTRRRGYHTATLLRNGLVLLASGYGGGDTRAELFDPQNASFRDLGSGLRSSGQHTAVLADDGSVLFIGGWNGAVALDTIDRYDAASGVFQALPGRLKSGRYDHASTLLADGRVFIAGGYNGSVYVGSAEVFDPKTGLSTSTKTAMTSARGKPTATRLPSGLVLITGGWNGSRQTEVAELFDPTSGLFTPTANSMIQGRSWHDATVLANETVLVIGGYTGGNSYSNTADVFNPTTRTFGTIFFDPRSFQPPLDADGDNVYHFTSIHIAPNTAVRLAGAAVNAAPIHWLASGAVLIEGTLDLNGEAGHPYTNVATERQPSVPGAGGFPGGMGGNAAAGIPAESGRGPEGGAVGVGGKFTGNPLLVPLVGGSGGGGQSDARTFRFGGGGGAGGGALLIASSASIRVDGAIFANGGASQGGACGSGAGAGGAIRLAAPTVSGTGRLQVREGAMDTTCGKAGATPGRIRLEAFDDRFTGQNDGPLQRASPTATFVPTTPPSKVRVVRIAGLDVPPNPTGSFVLPDVTINQSAAVLVEVEAREVPIGTKVDLHLVAEDGTTQVVQTGPLQGTEQLSTASASVTFPTGFTRGYARAVWR